MLRAETVHELRLGVEGLATGAIEPRVDALVDVSALVDPLEKLLDALSMARVGRPDEEVVRGVDLESHLAEGGRVPVDELLELEARFLRDPGDVRSVLVRAREEERVLPALTPVAGDDVGRDRRVRVPDMGRRVDVVDRCGDVEAHRRPSYGALSPARPSG